MYKKTVRESLGERGKTRTDRKLASKHAKISVSINIWATAYQRREQRHTIWWELHCIIPAARQCKKGSEDRRSFLSELPCFLDFSPASRLGDDSDTPPLVSWRKRTLPFSSFNPRRRQLPLLQLCKSMQRRIAQAGVRFVLFFLCFYFAWFLEFCFAWTWTKFTCLIWIRV